MKPRSGFTVIEILIAVGILGLMAVMLMPAIQNSLETRNLESVAQEIKSNLQKAKFQAVRTKMHHRLRFLYESGRWSYLIERQEIPNNWVIIPESQEQIIPDQFTLTVIIPDQNIEYSQLGLISNYDDSLNQIQIQSSHLSKYSQSDSRYIFIYRGGRIEITVN